MQMDEDREAQTHSEGATGDGPALFDVHNTPAESNSADTRSAKNKMQCQVQGCKADLGAGGKPYLVKKRLCTDHMRADAVMRKGYGEELWRFCFQCGKLELLEQFDGSKR